MSGSRTWFEKDFYKVLGVEETATPEEIKRAFKKLARANHPDRNPGDHAAEERMKDASEAYDVIADPAKRAEYDQMRHVARSGYAGGAPGAGWQTNVRFEDLPFDLGDLFGGGFGRGAGGARAHRPQRGADVEARARVGFVDAVRGTQVTLRHGGQDVKVKLPAGVEDGARLRIRGRGAAGPAGPGDLYVRVEVEPHPVFGRRGKDLTTEVTVPFTDAALGATVVVPTLDDPVTLKIKPGTQPGTTMRARGKGGPGGDLLVTVQVEVPASLTPEERELLERLAALRTGAAQEAV